MKERVVLSVPPGVMEILMDTTTAIQNPAAEIKAELAHFTGTSKWYRHPLFRDFLYNDGTQFLAERAGAGLW